jgi:hypothetical protein
MVKKHRWKSQMYKARAFAINSDNAKLRRGFSEILWRNCPRLWTATNATRNRDHRKIRPIPTLTKINTAGWMLQENLSHSRLKQERTTTLPRNK